jgi:hypothetical protein
MLSPMNTSAFAFCKHAFVARARGSPSKYAFVIFTYFFATQAFAWTDGELLIWITGNRPFHALTHLGEISDREIGAPVYNKKLVTGKVPAQLSELPAFASQRKVENPKAIVIMWDCKTPYFSWPFLASAGGYPFKKTAEGYDVNDIGVANAGALEGLKAIVQLLDRGILPKGSSQSVMGEKMASGQLALMITGPRDWTSMGAAFEIATNGRASPQVALQDALKNMERQP